MTTAMNNDLAKIAKAAGEIASPYARHLGIFNPHKHKLSATVIGCGAIGSFVAVGLAKMGVRDQTIYDMDSVETENLPVQLHMKSWIGREKTLATKHLIEECCPEDVDVSVKGEWKALDHHPKTDIVVLAVDSLEVRKAVWETVKYDSAVSLIVDARIGGQAMKLYAVNPNDTADIKTYDGSLASTKGSDLPCTERGVIDVSMIASGLLIRSIRRWVVTQKKETYRVVMLDTDFPNIVG
jgi:molybdopterin/thiamine biosynthesis adenylyltransferase